MASPLGAYYVRIKNQKGEQVAVLDDWVSLTYTKELNGLGSYQLVLNGDSTNVPLFELDGQVEIWRSVPGLGKDWYIDFEGFHRKQERQTTSDGKRLFVSSGVSYNDLLARAIIGYKEGTIRAEKNAPVETVMKEYVAENCTDLGDLTVVGRCNYDEHLNDDEGGLVYSAAVPGLAIDPDYARGIFWQGSRAFENLLTTLQDIAATTGVDFAVTGTGPGTFAFGVYINGFGRDLRHLDINRETGLNSAGNKPMLFSVPFGTLQNITYTLDRMTEANAIMVLGSGELSLREVYTVADLSAMRASPWNRREISRPGSDQQFDYQFRQLGAEELKNAAAREEMSFDPLQGETACYGIDYNVGDTVSAQYDDIYCHKRIVSGTITPAQDSETISMEFSDKYTSK
jgi:hypothetical protein